MRQLFSERVFLNMAGQESSQTVRLTLHMQGEEVSISALSAKLKGYNTKHIAPGKYWTYKDRLLDDIYDETYPFEE
jgi:hypothetical protein